MEVGRTPEPGDVRILVIDDEEIDLLSCARVLGRAGYQVETCQQSEAGLEQAVSRFYNVVIVDLRMPKMGGLEVLEAVREHQPETEVIVMTGYSTIEGAVEAMKQGASDYVSKPFRPDELEVTVGKALARQQLVLENRYLREELRDRGRLGSLIGRSPGMEHVFRQVLKVAPTSGTVLITGESGTGKELVARTIHHNSPRKLRAFTVVDCASLPPGLLESELFGHVRGSFTGAERTHRGLFELADGGTLFLDEVANVDLESQRKLLRVLESREFRPVGAESTQTTDIRLIAATSRDLGRMVAEGLFREDLFYRLSVVPLTLPPLRERGEDIGVLAWHFLREARETHGKHVDAIKPAAFDRLMTYGWPGNVRELRNTMERLVIMAEGSAITSEQTACLGRPAVDTPVVETLEALKEAKKAARDEATAPIERAFILSALERNDWNVSATARDIGMQRPNLHALLRKHGITVSRRGLRG